MSVHNLGQDANGLPAAWRPVTVDGAVVYVNTKEAMAVISEALIKKKIRRSSKLSTQSGTYVIQPHDDTLPPEWERAVVLQADGLTGSWIWHNLKTGGTTLKDPRQSIFENGDPLPAGWTVAYDEDGDMYFIDRNSGTVSYDDPRLVCTEVLGCEAERVAEKVLRSTLDGGEQDVTEMGLDTLDGVEATPEPAKIWTIGKLDHDGFNALKQYLTPKSALPPEVSSKSLNRYTNILPNPATRVRLADDYQPRTELSQYINANWIESFRGGKKQYIAAMGPLDNTIEAFWRMVWMVNSPAIVMTTPMMEQSVVKCARYWPTVKYNEEKQCGDKCWGNIRVAVVHGSRHPGYILTRIRLTKDKVVRMLDHFWYQDWPDHGVPSRAGATQVVAMMKTVRRVCQERGGGPAIVHCSAGIGRTGTFIAIDQCIQELETTGSVDPLQVIDKLRQARGGMVQHPQQYEFVYKACVEYARSICQTITVAGTGEEAMALSPPGSQRGGKPGEWKQSIKSKKPQVLASLIAQGRPEDMPEEEWKRANRKFVKQQASLRLPHSVRRKLDDAEKHGELRLGTLSGGTNDGKYRPTAKEVFAHLTEEPEQHS